MQVTVQVLNFHSWTFFFGLAFVVGLYSLHRLSFVQETSGTTDPLLVRDLLLEARRSIHSLSSAAGLLPCGPFVRPGSWRRDRRCGLHVQLADRNSARSPVAPAVAGDERPFWVTIEEAAGGRRAY